MGVGCSRDKVTDWLFWMLCTCEKSILGKSLGIPTEKFLSLVLSRNAIHLIIQLLFNYLSIGRLQEVKNKRRSLAVKVVVVTCERWSLTRALKYSDMTQKFWYFGKLAHKERWLLARGGRNWMFDCISYWIFNILFYNSLRMLLYHRVIPSIEFVSNHIYICMEWGTVIKEQ